MLRAESARRLGRARQARRRMRHVRRPRATLGRRKLRRSQRGAHARAGQPRRLDVARPHQRDIRVRRRAAAARVPGVPGNARAGERDALCDGRAELSRRFAGAQPMGPGGSRRSRNVTAHSRGRTATWRCRTTTPRSLRTSRAGTTPPTMERTARTAAPTRAIGRSAATGGCGCATTTTCTRYAGRGLTTAGPAQLAARSRVRCFLRSLVYVFVCLFVCLRAFAKVEPTVFGIWLDAFCGTAALR